MVTPTTQKLIITLLVLVIIGFFGYSIFFNTTPDASDLDIATLASNVENQDILTLADKLRAVTFDQSIFTSNLFLGLVDYETVLYPEAQGRTNPFAPIGTNDSTTITSTTTKRSS